MGLPRDFLPTIRRSVAVTALGPSSLRNQGAKGVISASREFLALLDLSTFMTADEDRFCAQLDSTSERLRKALPKGAQNWGASRKALNLFLRDALYNYYLATEYRLHRIENWLEIPLDSAVARGLKKLRGGERLQEWPGLKKLTPYVSAQFQALAMDIAKSRGLARVHLDIYLWLEERR